MKRWIIAITCVGLFPTGPFAAGMSGMKIEHLRCEYLLNPLGIDQTEPRLGWMLQSDSRGQKQTAYQILVADRPNKLAADEGNVWNSGKVVSTASLHIRVSGKTLESRRRYYWKVRVWDRDGKVSPWSEPATWSMGLLDAKAWRHARWIGAQGPATHTDAPLPAQMLRKEFQLDEPARHATVYVTALGLYELCINGQRVGNHQLAPEWTDYQRHIQYQTYDVTPLLKMGPNAISASLGDGWYAGRIGLSNIVKDGPLRAIYGPRPRLLLLLEITGSGGKQTFVSTDGSWKLTADGPIRAADILDGEIYDARQEMGGWQLPGFDDSQWVTATTMANTAGKLVAQMNEPVRVIKQRKPVEITEPAPGVYVFDLGQNMVGWCRLKVHGKRGQKIRLRHAEMLQKDGTIYRDNLRIPKDGGPYGARQEDTYICRGAGEEHFAPHFTFHGFRYVEVTGLEKKPGIDFLTGQVVCSSFPKAGTFQCSSAMLNQLNRNILWGQRGNMLGVPTDCPQRDERLGWMGDAQVFAPAACWNDRMAPFYTKWMRDVRDAQADDGRFPDFAPHPYDPNVRFSGVPAWGDAGVLVPWVVFQRYGDRQILRENYESSKRWIDWIQRNNPDGIWLKSRGNDYGDWLNGDTLIKKGYPKTGAEIPKDLFATLLYGHSADLVSRMANILGNEIDAQKYGHLADAIRQALQKKYVDQDARITGDTQAGYALALGFDMLPKNLRAKAAAHMVEAIKKYDWHISTGFVSTLQLMRALTASSQVDLAYRLINNKTFPSWGYSIEQGATTIWERWDGYVKGRGFQNPGMNSFNHYAYGCVGDWMWKNIVGINTEGPAFKRIVIRPRIGGGIAWAKGTYESIRGPISVDWRKTGESLSLSLSIPPNTTATVYVPIGENSTVRESGAPVEEAMGVKFLRNEDGCAVFAVDSGSYRFQCHAGIACPARAASSRLEQTDVYVSGQGGYHTYRIPAIVRTNRGTLLAFCEGRKQSSSDAGDIDLLLRRSFDQGKTWSDAKIVWDDSDNTCGNPCPVVDRNTGTIWLPLTWNSGKIHEGGIQPGFGTDSRRVFMTSSKDDGKTWAEPHEITADVKEKDWSWYATGPGAGIQIEHGKYRGRLVIPCDHKTSAQAPAGYYSHVIYSDDHGKTWQPGGTTPAGMVNECEVVELAGGRLLLNMRNYDRSVHARQIAFSGDGGLTWQDQRYAKTLIEPICQASIRRARWPKGNEPGVILFSNPASKKGRKNMTVRASTDDGATWPVRRQIHPAGSAYSCLVVLTDGRIGCLYEADDYRRIIFASFSYAWLTEEP